MKKVIFILIIYTLIPDFIIPQINKINSSPVMVIDSVSFTSSNLPIVVINTNGQVIPDADKITADMGIIYNGEGIRNNITDPFNNYNGKIGIEIRGSTSQQFPKKQYAVETRDLAGNDLDASLLGLPAESDWVLFAPYDDKSLIRDALAYRIARDMGRYASRSKFCEVVLNDEYMGVYVLFEKIKRDANRVNIKKLETLDTSGTSLTGGYIIKIDKTDGENNSGWYSNYLPYPQSPNKVLYQYHYPKPDEIVTQQKSYIQSKIFAFETIMNYSSNISDSATGYPKYINSDSFVDFIFVNEITKNVDAYRLSTYLYKNRDDIDPRIYAGPVWDFNLGFGNANYYDGWKTDGWQLEYLTDYITNQSDEYFLTPFWWRKLFDDTKFRNKMYTRWQSLRTNSLTNSKIISYIDSLVTLLGEAQVRNFEKWPVLGQWVWPNYYIGQTYQDEINYLKNWILSRLYWLNQNMVGEPTAIETDKNNLPNEFILVQNYPNPFNPSTKISWKSPADSYEKLKIFDVLGNEIVTLIDEYKPAGRYEVIFNSSNYNLPSGMYFYQLEMGSYIRTKKMMLIK